MYYVAGNEFVKGYTFGMVPIREFNLVRQRGDMPCYITKNPDGLQSTSHHASLYIIKENEEGYELIRVQFRNEHSPRRIVLRKSTDLWNYLQRSIQYAEANDKFYE